MAALAVGFAALSPAALAGSQAPRPWRLVVDTDMGLDDVRALFALLSDKGAQTDCIVITEGSASRAKGIENLASLLDAMHKDRIAIFAGASLDVDAPPWRETANSLGGVPIADRPTEDSQAGDLAELRDRLSAAGSGIDYLALGPLTSAASIVSDPRALAAIDTVWIPVRVDGAEVSGWNLSRDARSAERVMKAARCVVLIDVSGAAEIEARDLFSSLDDISPAGRWIKHSLAASSGHGVHGFLHDELAAAALARPALIDIGEKAYRVGFARGVFSLAAAPDGNVRLATMKRPNATAGVLRELWRAPAHFEHPDSSSIPVVDLLKTFHGHLGPYVVIGYRMGRLALEATGSKGYFDISATVYSFLEPPRSCLIDGVQLGAGCTLGKRNIEVHATDGPAYAVFEAANGARVTVKLRPEAAALVGRLIEEKGVEAAGMDLLAMKQEDLFETESEPLLKERIPAQ
ncbi:MAG: FmdE family protein [Candidatus Krumholzibacteriia bacterium]